MAEPTEGVGAPPPAIAPINDDDDIYRRILLLPNWIVSDPKSPSGKRLSSAAYQPQRDSPCSGYVAKECEFADVLGVYTEGVSIGAITAGDIRGRGVTIQRDVVPGEHPSHVHLIEPTGLSKGQRHGLRSYLAEKTRCVYGTPWG